MTTTTESFITDQAWRDYHAINQYGSKIAFDKPLPGWRVDMVYADGTIADYENITRSGTCWFHLEETPEDLLKVPVSELRTALDQCNKCHCGYRVMRMVWDLLIFMYKQEATRLWIEDPDSHPQVGSAGDRTDLAAFVLTRVHAHGRGAKTYDPLDPPGTIRVSDTRLVEVHIPTEFRFKPVAKNIAQKIRDRYDVPVHIIEGTIFDFNASSDDIPAPDHWDDNLNLIKETLIALENDNPLPATLSRDNSEAHHDPT